VLSWHSCSVACSNVAIFDKHVQSIATSELIILVSEIECGKPERKYGFAASKY
jgi:hypothetical protein